MIVCEPHQVWPLRSECCGRGAPTNVVCAECMKMCCRGGNNSVVRGLTEKKCLVIQISLMWPAVAQCKNW